MSKVKIKTETKCMLTLIKDKVGRNKWGAWKSLYVCDCGNEKIAYRLHVKSGHTRSCGCLFHCAGGKILGIKSTEYITWWSMIDRCHNPNNKNYKRYGGRGIFVCEEWRTNSIQFLEDMGRKPEKGLSLDRIDNNKGYSKNNCRWASDKVQANNKRRAFNVIVYKGETQKDASKRLGASHQLISQRVHAGWSLEDAFNIPVGCKNSNVIHKKRNYDKFKGETRADAGKRLRLAKGAVSARLSLGWSMEDAFTLPKGSRKPRVCNTKE